MTIRHLAVIHWTSSTPQNNVLITHFIQESCFRVDNLKVHNNKGQKPDGQNGPKQNIRAVCRRSTDNRNNGNFSKPVLRTTHCKCNTWMEAAPQKLQHPRGSSDSNDIEHSSWTFIVLDANKLPFCSAKSWRIVAELEDTIGGRTVYISSSLLYFAFLLDIALGCLLILYSYMVL